MKLRYAEPDLSIAKKLGDRRLQWLIELGAEELRHAGPEEPGFLFGYQQGMERLRRQVGNRSHVRDRPEEREELIRLDHVLERLTEQSIEVPTPRLGFSRWMLNRRLTSRSRFLCARQPRRGSAAVSRRKRETFGS